MIRQVNGFWIVTLRNGDCLACTTKEEAYRAWRDSIGRIQFVSAGATRKR